MTTLIRSDTDRPVVPGDPRWAQFMDRLIGPEGCNFREDPRWTWTCFGGRDKRFSTLILTSMGLSRAAVRASLAYYERRGGYCDCEVVFNVASPTGFELAGR